MSWLQRRTVSSLLVRPPKPYRGWGSALLLTLIVSSAPRAAQLEIVGRTVTPHILASAMRYAREPDSELGARVQLFVRNSSEHPIRLDASTPLTLRDRSPDELVASDEWTWHDFPIAWPETELELAPGAMTVWNFNGRGSPWGVGTASTLTIGVDGALHESTFDITAPEAWISAVTFLEANHKVVPDEVVIHVANKGDAPLQLKGLVLWLPRGNATWRELHVHKAVTDFECWPADGTLPAREKAIIRARVGKLPLSYAAVEVQIEDANSVKSSLWAQLRVKREVFDISGGWVQGGRHAQQMMTFEPFLKTLRRMHVNTAHLSDNIPGYSDQATPGGLYDRYPLKYFNALTPMSHYEADAVLPRVHAVEFLGEPQYGGGRPVAPMEVWRRLAPYQASKLPTTITHSEERIWRYYAGLSDYPHYDAYRVCAPSPDAWFKYDRWGGRKIGWGAPLETIGDMCRSLRELNRPMPTAYWSQGPHHGWGPMWGRKRASPTPDELRLQAYHALANRITSLYWFNLSLPSLIKYRDTLDELTRIGREIRMLDQFYLEGDAYRHHRVLRDGQPDWDLASIVAPRGVLLFALDLDYEPSQTAHVFEFKPPRVATMFYELPIWCRAPAEVFRVDSEGTHEVAYRIVDGGINLTDTLHKVGIYVVAANPGQRADLDARREELVRAEEQFGFDPARNDADFAELVRFVKSLSED
jgi:hypothetical protein